MNKSSSVWQVAVATAAFIMVAGLTANAADAAAKIGSIGKITGKASILGADAVVRTAVKAGDPVLEGDQIQTDDGEVEISLDDGAKMKVTPFTSAKIEERKERKALSMGAMQDVRRVTCYVGKFWFESGKDSNKKNFVQSPTAVCALRGTVVEFGYIDLKSLLDLKSGDADIFGDVQKGFFANPTVDKAKKSKVYEALQKIQAEAKPNATAVEKLALQSQALDALKSAATELAANPDPIVQNVAKATEFAIDAKKSAVEAQKTVEVATAKKEEAEAKADKAQGAAKEEAKKEVKKLEDALAAITAEANYTKAAAETAADWVKEAANPKGLITGAPGVGNVVANTPVVGQVVSFIEDILKGAVGAAGNITGIEALQQNAVSQAKAAADAAKEGANSASQISNDSNAGRTIVVPTPRPTPLPTPVPTPIPTGAPYP